MVLSLSPGPAPVERAEHLKKFANMWRITDDFWDNWKQLLAMFERAEKWCIHSGPGHWPDADMLPIGALRQDYRPDDWTNFTDPELITMMSLWCLMRSPLMIGGELTKYNEMMDKARRIATDRMIAEAEQLGADAIVCFRYSTSSIMQSAAEIMAYGTAVKFK
jgi:hypothetical protein